MRIARFKIGKQIKYGVVHKNKIEVYKGKPFDFQFKPSGIIYDLNQIELVAPCNPSKIICLGVNYKDHAKEFNQKIPSNPLIFLKPPSAVIGPNENIVLPNNNRIDYECEFAIVILRKAKDVNLDKVKDYILGYTCFNDISDRYAQKEDIQWTRAKAYDTFAPIGPWIETELDPNNLKIETYLNGELKQSSNTKYMIHNAYYLVSYISSIMTLLPGDVIATGTPSGVGPLKPGDIVEIRIEKIGSLTNKVTSKL